MNLHKDHSPIGSLLSEMDRDILASTSTAASTVTSSNNNNGNKLNDNYTIHPDSRHQGKSNKRKRQRRDQRRNSTRYGLPNLSINNELNLPFFTKCAKVIRKYLKFVGPGIMVSVLYLDPGNYSSSVSAGFTHKYKLLFSILISTLMACFLQILSIKLGTVTGLDLAQNCREHLPKRLNISLYVLAEIAIIATDLAEVVGTAISLKILFGIPLIFGVILTVIDVLIVLMAYRPNGPMFIIRIFEGFISVLVAGTVVCFSIELYQISPNTSFGEVMSGFLPSGDVFEGDGLYLSLAILGATVMPHSLYLGSGLVQTRLRDYDEKAGNYTPPLKPVLELDTELTLQDNNEDIYSNYRPSLDAIRDAMRYSIVELILSLFTVALFVNSAILIVAGSTLGKTTEDDVSTSELDLFTIYDLLTKYLSKSAGILYASALLLSGQSAGVVCTLLGQMVSEGFLHWSLPPLLRRLLTRAVAITPCLILVLVSGRKGLSALLNASQVVLLLLLPIVSAPLIYFTSNKAIMRVSTNRNCNYSNGRYQAMELDDFTHEPLIEGEDFEIDDEDDYSIEDSFEEEEKFVDMSNGPVTSLFAILIWGLISFLNGFLLISMALGREIPM